MSLSLVSALFAKMQPSPQRAADASVGSHSEGWSLGGMPGLSTGSGTSRAPWVSRARARADGSTEAPSAVALADDSVGAPPRVVAAELEGSHALLGCSPWAPTSPGSTTVLQPQMEAALQPQVGDDGTLINLATDSALLGARAVLMTPTATRARMVWCYPTHTQTNTNQAGSL